MIRWLMALSLCVTLAGCAGKQQVAEPVDGSGGLADLDKLDAETIANSPCGNPDWSQLPEGSDAPDPE